MSTTIHGHLGLAPLHYRPAGHTDASTGRPAGVCGVIDPIGSTTDPDAVTCEDCLAHGVTVTLSPAAVGYIRDLAAVDDGEHVPDTLTADDLEFLGRDPGLRDT